MKIIEFIKDIIAPKKCYFCSAEGHFFCPQCYKSFPIISELCYVCKHSSSHFTIHDHCRRYLDVQSLIVLFPYQKIQKLIKDSKYYAKKDILQDVWDYAWKVLLEKLEIRNSSDYIILPIPMNFWRKSKRWYNHADILAKYISKSSGIDYHTKIIKRVKNTLQQSRLTRTERLSNLDGAFKIDDKYKHLIGWKKIILVDDVVSTWVTFLEVAAAFDGQDIVSIDCLAIASDTKIFDEKE